MKVIQIVMEEVTKTVYDDYLPCLPMKVITDITAFMNTLSANNFYDFLFSFLIDVAINMIEKAYVSQLQGLVVEKIQNQFEEINKFYQNFINDTEEEIQELRNDNANSEDENQYVMIYQEADEIDFFEEDEAEQYNQLTPTFRPNDSSQLLDSQINSI